MDRERLAAASASETAVCETGRPPNQALGSRTSLVGWAQGNEVSCTRYIQLPMVVELRVYKTRKYEEYELPCPNQLLKTGKASKGEGIRTLIQCREIAAAID